VPGRKTDQKDAEWIAQLLQHGLLRPSYVPCEIIRDLLGYCSVDLDKLTIRPPCESLLEVF
jgi:hypothetical protein